jgi:limonene-1,2-epoxide hydrolase
MADTDSDKLRTALAMIDAWNRVDLDAVIDLFAEDGQMHLMMEAKATIGRPALRRRIGKLCQAATEVNIVVRTAGVINGSVFLERVDNFVIGGHTGAMPVVGVLEIEDGRVQMWREYYDHLTLRKGLGLE